MVYRGAVGKGYSKRGHGQKYSYYTLHKVLGTMSAEPSEGVALTDMYP